MTFPRLSSCDETGWTPVVSPTTIKFLSFEKKQYFVKPDNFVSIVYVHFLQYVIYTKFTKKQVVKKT